MTGQKNTGQSEGMKSLSLQAIDLGMHVEIEFVSEEGIERMLFDLVPDAQADFSHGFLGIGTTLAQAILGKEEGMVIPYRVGDGIEVRILCVAHSDQAPDKDVQKRREAVIRKAVEQSDRTNAMIFASSLNGKWGDYDPTGFTEEIEAEALPDESEETEP
jgi:hypothetical protein